MKNNLYHFFLGRNELLSIKELECIFGKTPKLLQKGIVSLELKKEDEAVQDALGGTIKIAEILGECTEKELEAAIIEVLESERKEGRKTVLALNYHGKKKEQQFLRTHLIGVKKKTDFSLRFCNGNFKNVSSVVTWKEIIRKKNVELNIVELDSGKLQVSQTFSCQNIDAYSDRDYGKPARDAKVGMLPPKLAQMLINYAGEHKALWDPFCGSGTVLMEALLQGKNVIGTDLSDRMIEASKTNVDWFKNTRQGAEISGVYKIFQHDATKSIDIEADVIVTEGYLGEPKRLKPNNIELQKTDEELSRLYQPFFQYCKKNKIKTIVMCLPVYRMQQGLGFMKKTLATITQSGYNLAALSDKDRPTLLYKRDNQFVFREIIKLTLK